MRRLVALLVLLAPALARAQGADLRVDLPPSAPSTLAMRAPATPPATPPAKPKPAAGARAEWVDRYVAIPAQLDELSDKVVFHFQIGQELEQGQLTGQRMVSGEPIAPDNRNTRFFTVGDLVAGSNGLVLTPLSTYLAAHFRFDQDGTPAHTSAPSLYDAAPEASALLVRSAYAEVSDLGPAWLAPLRVRAGRQFRYGLSVLHFDGLSLWYDSAVVSASAYAGERVSLYRDQLQAEGLSALAPPLAVGPLAGATVDVRIARSGDYALVLGGEALRWDGHGFGQGTLRWQLGPDAALSSYVRMGSGRVLRWGAGVRARLSKTSTFSLDGEHRLADDLAYDLIVRPRDDGADAARFLFLGPRVPELRLAGRAGTVLLDNLDVLVSLAGSLPVGGPDNPWSAPYGELGAALDGRLASGLSLAVSVRGRRYFRPTPDPTLPLEPFGDVASEGQTSVYDAATRVRYAVGPRSFAAEAELYYHTERNRHLERPEDSRLPYQQIARTDGRGGVRFRVEGWLGTRARLLADYEISATPNLATDVRGLQTLRLLAEVSF